MFNHRYGDWIKLVVTNTFELPVEVRIFKNRAKESLEERLAEVNEKLAELRAIQKYVRTKKRD